VFGGLNRLLVAALVAGIAFAAPTAAFASGCGGGPSAQNVYKECLPSAGGGKPSGGGGSKSTGGVHTGSNSTSTTHVSAPAAKALRHAGRDRRVLQGLINGQSPSLLTSPTVATTTPSAVGSAFDLSSGPTALLIALAATALLIFCGTGMRVWRHRHRS
jgi:hypothetical protein